MKKKRLFFLRGLAVAVLAAVLLLDAAFVVIRDRDFSAAENRTLQRLPKLTLSGATSGRFETRFEDYVNDQFPFRDAWVSLKGTADRLLGRVESNGVFLGKRGYLIQDFAEPDAAAYARNLRALRDFAARHAGLPQYVMIAPTALTVCADCLPAFAPAGDEGGFLDRLADDLSDTPAAFIDLRPALAAQAGERQLYYRTDHHWTTDAAYAAYLRLSAAAGLSGESVRYERRLLSNRFTGTLTASSGFRTSQRDDLYAYFPQDGGARYVVTYVGENVRSASVYQSERLDERDQYAVFFGGNHPEIRIETTVDNDRALLVLKDSYANCFIPFLVQDYRKLVIVDPRYYTGDLEVLMASEGIGEVLFLYNANTFASDTMLRQDIAPQA